MHSHDTHKLPTLDHNCIPPEPDSLAYVGLLARGAFQRKVVAEIYFLEEAGVVAVDPIQRDILNHVLPARHHHKVARAAQPSQRLKSA